MNSNRLSKCFIIFLLSLWISTLIWNSDCGYLIKIGCSLVLCLFIWFLLLLIKYSVSEDRPFISSCKQLFLSLIFYYAGALMMRRLCRISKNIAKCQEEFLLHLLKSNEKTLFGSDHKFSEIKSPAEYKQRVPLSFPADYSNYVKMIADGEENILTSSKISRMVTTSGTTGKPTFLPYTLNQKYFGFLYFGSIYFNRLFSKYPGAWRIQKSFRLMYLLKWRYTKAGIRYGPLSSDPDDFKKTDFLNSTPFVAFEISDEKYCQYVHLLFALKERHIGRIESTFASVIWSAVLTLRSNWDELVSNIQTGTLTERIEIDPGIRSAIQSLLKPDPERAKELRDEMKLGRKGLFLRIWPGINAVMCIDTGPFQIYRKHLLKDELYGIPIYCSFYGASESILGINIWPKQFYEIEDNDVTGFHLLPEMVFYEFIPLDQMDEKIPNTLLMHEVNVGETYELVLTTMSGLCRYRINDVVRVVRKEDQCPIVQYLYRKGTLLNVRSEKLGEDYFYQCLLSTLLNCDLEPVEYCCVESPHYQFAIGEESSEAPFYIVFIELSTDREMVVDVNTISKKLDFALSEDNAVYSSYRQNNSIGAPVVYIVKDGTFQKLRTHLLEVTQASPNQLKIPRLLKREGAIRLMRECRK